MPDPKEPAIDAGKSNDQIPSDASQTVEVKMSSEALKQRLEESRGAARKDLLKKLGVDSEAELERRLKAAKEAEEAQLSEKEKQEKRIKELEPAAKRAVELEKRFADSVQKRFEALPDAERAIVEKYGDDPERRDAFLSYREELRATWQAETGGAPAPKTGTPPAAKTAPPAGAPRQTAQPTMFERYTELRSNPKTSLQADLFYQANQGAIERDRPQ